MPIAHDVSTNGGASAASPLTWSHTVTAGAQNVILLVWVGNRDSTFKETAVTFGGTSMTQIGTPVALSASIVGVYFLIVPANLIGSAHTVSVTSSSTTCIVGISASYTGVDPNITFGASAWKANAVATATNSISSLTVGATQMLASAFFMQNSFATTYNGTARVESNNTTPLAHTIANGDLAIGSATSTWQTGTQNSSQFAVVLSAAPPTPPTGNLGPRRPAFAGRPPSRGRF